MSLRTDKLLQNLGIDPETVHFDVTIITPDEMRELNRQHRGKDKTTDVLSFPMLELKPGEIPTRATFPLDINPETDKIELGDIVVNETEPDPEFLIDHGLMHLLGYHHGDHEEDH